MFPAQFSSLPGISSPACACLTTKSCYLSAVTATAAAIGFPPKVEPCCPGRITSITSLHDNAAETGQAPPDSLLKSGYPDEHSHSHKPAICLYRAMPVCTSSAIKVHCGHGTSRNIFSNIPHRVHKHLPLPEWAQRESGHMRMFVQHFRQCFGIIVGNHDKAGGKRSVVIVKRPDQWRKNDSGSTPMKIIPYNDFRVSLGSFFTSYAHLRQSFNAVSTASAPVFIGKTLSYPK